MYNTKAVSNIYLMNTDMIPKKSTVIVKDIPVTLDTQCLSKTELATLLENLASLGYIADAKLYTWLASVDREDAMYCYNTTMTILRDMLGAKEYHPMYPNFPEQVAEADGAELFINALLHYYTAGQWMPEYVTSAREKINVTKTRTLKAGTIYDFLAFANNIMMSKTSISEDDKSVLNTMFSLFTSSEISMPDNIEHKENKAYIWSKYIETYGLANASGIYKAFTTATDILRLATAMSDGDVSLATNCKFRSFTRAERRMFMQMLSGIKYNQLKMDMDKYSNRWKRFGEKLHPSEYKSYETVNKAFKAIRSNENIESFEGKVNNLINFGNTIGAAELLASRPGELARNLDRLLCKSNEMQITKIEDIFAHVATEIDTPVLLQVLYHFIGREVSADTTEKKERTRIIFPKGNVANTYVLDDTVKCINENVRSSMVEICKNALKCKYKQRECMGKVYIDESLKGYLVPFSQRSASRSIKTIVRGSHVRFDKDCKVIRSFIWWKNGKERTDIDLSAIALNDDFEYMEHVSYTCLRSRERDAIHSGDIVDAPNGACEFVDIDIDKMLNRGIRYVAFNVYSFTYQKFYELPECFMGWMERDNLGYYQEVYDARTVKNKIDLTGETRVNIPMVVDLKNREIIWADLALKKDAQWNCVETNKHDICKIIRGMINLNKANIYDLITFNAEVRGEIVEKKEDADIVFSEHEGITPFDTDEFMAKYI